ncbi:hypothetical protein AB0K11_02655 [Mycobacterium sp. NPDC050551]|uniref:hypothetical protein n=1 Tax=Mycobacterium sp. NPDC050551 TaxID=3155407 RepID=UPI0034477688
MAPDWRFAIDEILYSLSFTEQITEEFVTWIADNAVRYEALDLGPQAYYKAINDSLASGEILDGRGQLPQFNQTQLADFLRAVAAELDVRRPWPEPNFRSLDSSDSRKAFSQAVPVARLQATVREITDLLQKGFRPVGDSHPERQLLVLQLITGETVFLSGIDRRGETVTLSADPSDSGANASTIEHFIAATNLPSDLVIT